MSVKEKPFVVCRFDEKVHRDLALVGRGNSSGARWRSNLTPLALFKARIYHLTAHFRSHHFWARPSAYSFSAVAAWAEHPAFHVA